MSTPDEKEPTGISPEAAEAQPAEPVAEPDEVTEVGIRSPAFPRRALLRAGWAIPAVVALEPLLPTQAQAAFANSGGFANFPGGFGNTFDNVFRNRP